MKKLLALVLALVMTLGLATVGANAANDQYSDKTDIAYEEAVAVLSEIGILEGNEKGQFLPKEQLDRASAAKIIAYLALGNKTAAALQGSGTKFSDVPASHWAAGYIEYLATAGVVAGDGTGKFLPSAPLTANAFAKMLLGVLGYKSDIEGLVGDDWQINTAKLANEVGLFDGNKSAVGTATVARDEAALYAFNTILKPVVEYDSTVHFETGNGGSVTIGNNKAQEKTTANANKQTISDETGKDSRYIVEFAEQQYPDLVLVGRSKPDYDDLGRPVRHWTNNKKDLGEFVRKDAFVTSWTKNVTAKDIYSLLGATYYDALKSKSTNLLSTLDGVRRDAIEAGKNLVKSERTFDDYINKNNSTTINGSGNGTVTELYTDEHKNLCFVSYNTWVFQATSDYNAASESITLKAAGDTNIRLSNSSRLDLSDFPEIKDWKKDDYILVTAAADTSAGLFDVKTAEKATVLTGKVDGYSYDKDYNVTIDGTKYSYSKTTLDKAEDNVKKTLYTVGQEATVVMDANGYIIAVDKAVVSNNYVFINKFGSSSGLKTNAVASAIFTDGTTAEITVKSAHDYKDGNKQETSKRTIAGWGDGDNKKYHENKWYSYSKSSDGQYTLYNANGTQGSATYTRGTTNLNVTKSATVKFLNDTGVEDTTDIRKVLLANNNTIVVVQDKNDNVNVYTGVSSLPGITLTAAGSEANVYARYNSSKYASLVYVKLTGNATITGSANDKLIYVIGFAAESRGADNEAFYTYKVLDGATETTRNADNEITGNKNANYYDVANYATENSKGQLTDFQEIDPGTTNDVVKKKDLASISYSAGTLNLGGDVYRVDENTEITLVVRGAAKGMLRDKAKGSYEAEAGISAGTLASRFDNMTGINYNYVLRLTNAKESNTVKELFVTVTAASAATAGAGGGAPTTAAVVKTDATTLDNAARNAPYNLVKGGNTAVATDGAAKYVPSENRIYFQLKTTDDAATDSFEGLCVKENVNGTVYTTDYSTIANVASAGNGKSTYVYYVQYKPHGSGNPSLTIDAQKAVPQTWYVGYTTTDLAAGSTLSNQNTTVTAGTAATFSFTVSKPTGATAWSLTVTDANATTIKYVDSNNASVNLQSGVEKTGLTEDSVTVTVTQDTSNATAAVTVKTAAQDPSADENDGADS